MHDFTFYIFHVELIQLQLIFLITLNVFPGVTVTANIRHIPYRFLFSNFSVETAWC